MIEESHHADVLIGIKLGCLNQTLEAAVGAVQVVKARREDKLLSDAANGAGLQIRHAQLKVTNVCGLTLEFASQQGHQRGVVLAAVAGHRRLQGPLEGGGQDGHQLRLLVELEGSPLLGRREVNGEVGDAQDRALHMHQLVGQQARGILDNDTARNSQVAIKPGVPETAAVSLHTHGQIARLGQCGARLHAQARAVRVGTDDAKAIARSIATTHSKSDEGGLVASEKVLARRLGCPGIALLELLKARSQQTCACLIHRMEWGGAGVHKGEKASSTSENFGHWIKPYAKPAQHGWHPGRRPRSRGAR
eukprot:m.227119 g.227119  ORF g.227119 m.227119 type:complete len:306 (-) comp17120_c0_seq1:46-963(-)